MNKLDYFCAGITEIEQSIRDKQTTLRELVDFYIDRIESLDPTYKAFITKTFDLARKRATRYDNALEQSYILPYAIKDNILTKSIWTTAASKMLENFIPPYDATVINKLADSGGILLGKTNLDEFAHGSSTENSYFGPTLNPWDRSRVPGGSSGGSAAAVALRMCKFALGSDTGGSIRQPAAFCGVVGLKPTYGLVSRYGLIAMASSMDQIGPITTSVADSARVLSYITGFDSHDATSTKRDKVDYTAALDAKSVKKIGIPSEFFGEGLDHKVKKVVNSAIDDLSNAGYEVVKIKLPHVLEYSLAVYYIMQTAEVSSNLARFDGIKYGHSVHKSKENLDEVYLDSRAEGFGVEAKRRIILGTFVLSSGYFDAYYRQAARVRYKIREDFKKAFSEVDVVISPTTPTLPFKIGERTTDPLQMYMADLYTAGANLAGIPAMSIPVGFVDGLPVGMQIMADSFEEGKLLELGQAYEQSHEWKDKLPKTD